MKKLQKLTAFLAAGLISISAVSASSTAYAASDIKGDVNDDGAFNVADMVSFVKWLQGNGSLKAGKNADISGDGRVDVFDLVAMRSELVRAVIGTAKPLLIIDQEFVEGLGSVHYDLVSVIDTMGFRNVKKFDTIEITDDTCAQTCGQIMYDPIAKGQIDDGVLIKAIEDFSANAAKYKDCEMKNYGGVTYDTGRSKLYILCPDESGNMKPLLLGWFGSTNAELDNEEVAEFVALLVKNGVYCDEATYWQAKNFVVPPENMPYFDITQETTPAVQQNVWDVLKSQYPNTDFSDFTLKYEPDHPLKNHLDTMTFSVYYKGILCHGWGNLNLDSNIYVTQDPSKTNFTVTPEALAAVDVNAKCMAPEDLARKYTFDPETDYVEKVIYAPKKDSMPVLAYRVITPASGGETIINAVTGQLVEYISYTVV